MADTTRVTVTLPTEQLARLRSLTDDIPGYVAEAVAERMRNHSLAEERCHLLAEDLRRYEEEHGAFTEEELAQARAEIFGAADPPGPADAAG